MRRLLLLFVLCVAALASGPAVTHAQTDSSRPPDKCFVLGPNLEEPTCSQGADGKWTVSYPGGSRRSAGDAGIPSGIVIFIVGALIVGIGFTIWKVSMARRMATESGLDPDRATAVTLLSDDGLDATYIATSVRGNATPEPAPGASTGERLRELQQLRDDGLVTADEYDTRRRAILDAL